MGSLGNALEQAAQSVYADDGNPNVDEDAQTSTAVESSVIPPEDGADTEDKPLAAAAVPTPSEAEQLQQILSAYGIDKSNANSTVQAARAFYQYGYLIEKDPRQFAKILKTQSPQIYETFVNGITDEYLETHDQQVKPVTAQPESNAEVRALKERLAAIEGSITQTQQQTAYNNAVSAYRNKVDDAVGKLTDLKPGQAKAVKAMLRDSLEQDPQAVQRIYQGVHVDIPRHLQKVMNEFTDATVLDTEQEQVKREKVNASGSRSISSGAQTTSKGATSAADSWDAAEAAYASALNKAKRK